MTMLQEQIIARVCKVCSQDLDIVAAVQDDGSETRGEGGLPSGLAFYVFLKDEVIGAFDELCWLERIAPVLLHLTDETGTHTAIFEGLIRGEFHFLPVSEIGSIRGRKDVEAFPKPAATVIVDRSHRLEALLAELTGGPEPFTQENAQRLWDNFLNAVLVGTDWLVRGERAAAHSGLHFVHRYLLWMVRFWEESVLHRPFPARHFEEDVSARANERFVRCTGSLRPGEVKRAYRESWQWGKETAQALSTWYDMDLNGGIVAGIDARLLSMPIEDRDVKRSPRAEKTTL